MKRYNIVNNSLGWLCFAVAAVTYLLTLEPTASFWDCPEFIAQGAKLEVGHPPGNPIFMLAARFFVTCFGGGMDKAAIAVNSMSALLSAATILLLFWTITALVKRIVMSDNDKEPSLSKMIVIMGAGLCGALAYTWSDTFWFSAVEGEVYAFSSFCTALVFWLILKWENRADEPHSDRYLVLIAYVIGVSIAVHLLNLLCIPAIVLVFYYRKAKKADVKGSLIALGVSFAIVAAILYGLVPGFIKVAQWFELIFINELGMSYNTGVVIYAAVLLAVLAATTYLLYTEKDPKLTRLLILACLMLSGLTFATDSPAVWLVLIAAASAYLLVFCKKLPYRVMTVGVLSVMVIFIGYSSYALLLIRASANTPMNQNAPDNVFSLSSYLNREQYGQRPLFLGPVFAEALDIKQYKDAEGNAISYVAVDENGRPATRVEDGLLRNAYGTLVDNGRLTYSQVQKKSADEPDRYVKETWAPDYQSTPDLNMLFTRIYSSDGSHIEGYKGWSMYYNEDIENLRKIVPPATLQQWIEQGAAPLYEIAPYLSHLTTINTDTEGHPDGNVLVWKPTFADNMRYFLNYQLNHMYWRYFMWNFAGRQNDIQGNGESHLGNWISGIPFIDNMRLGDQSLVPEEFTTGNKGHNVFYLLPLILGILGIIWQSLMHHRHNPNRGIEQFWVVFFLFFMTGIAIVLYLNQTPGQPRERDYAFAGSFYAFAIWIGMGVPAIAALIGKLVTGRSKALVVNGEQNAEAHAPQDKKALAAAVVATVIGLAVPLQMVSQTWDDHDRSGRYTARDFGENYLNSLEPNSIIFTNGDNDTFPLWYAQEVEGVRTDVRVVNLSYLSTDWYANQLTIPSHDADAVPMTAKPTDWAYDAFAYSFGRPGAQNTPFYDAVESLEEFYKSQPSTEYTSRPIHLLDCPNLLMSVDTVAVARRFGLGSPSADPELRSAVQPITSSALSGGFSLSKLLSMDIIANSVAGGFERPVYFATTVPESYYLGLTPYLSSTGMAQQVTPFRLAPSSPTVEKAYENIVGKYRWGGLDSGKDLYLDETVRRMVASVRNSVIDVAENLVNTGNLPASSFAVANARETGKPVPANRYDMARIMLNMLQEKIPESVARYESLTDMPIIILYLKLYAATGNADDLARAQALMQSSTDRYAKLTKYAASLDGARLHRMGNTETFALRYTPLLIGLANYTDIYTALSKEPEANADLLEKLPGTLSIDNASYIYHWLYLEDMPAEELEKYQEVAQGSDLEALINNALIILEAHKRTGIPVMDRTKKLINQYGLTISDLQRLNPA